MPISFFVLCIFLFCLLALPRLKDTCADHVAACLIKELHEEDTFVSLVSLIKGLHACNVVPYLITKPQSNQSHFYIF